MKLNIILAISNNRAIGLNNQLPWGRDMPADLDYFKKMTLNKTVVMGRKTYDSTGKALPKRRNIVLTRDSSFHPPDAEVVHSADELERLLGDADDVMLIGGVQVCMELMRFVEKIYLTAIDVDCEGDVFLPEVPQEFRLISAEPLLKDGHNKYDCEFRVYGRV
jgi:dihydrofolate reductase